MQALTSTSIISSTSATCALRSTSSTNVHFARTVNTPTPAAGRCMRACGTARPNAPTISTRPPVNRRPANQFSPSSRVAARPQPLGHAQQRAQDATAEHFFR